MGLLRKLSKVPWFLVPTAAIVLLLLALVLIVGPRTLTGSTEGLGPADRLKAENDVRATLIQGLGGLVLAGGLVVTYRTFRQNRLEQDRSFELHRTEQVNDLYTRAVEQLGHAQASVRLGSLYSLEGLAQTNPQLRQTIVNVICAYLRMPYAPRNPSDEDVEGGDGNNRPTSHRPALPIGPGPDTAQEMQVRRTAQSLLETHLKRPDVVRMVEGEWRPVRLPGALFWPGIRLDLREATLVDLDLRESIIHCGDFRGARMLGSTQFDHVTFTGNVDFTSARFEGSASFLDVTFRKNAYFVDMTVLGGAYFNCSIFHRDVSFFDTDFSGPAEFLSVTFKDGAVFLQATFTEEPELRESRAPLRPECTAGLDGLVTYPAGWMELPQGWAVRADPENPEWGTLVQTGN